LFNLLLVVGEGACYVILKNRNFSVFMVSLVLFSFVTCGGGSSSDDEASDNTEPIVQAGNNQTADEGSSVSFSGSFTDPDVEDTHTIEWDFGDGHTSSASLTPSHTYANNGSYTVRLTVTDSSSRTGTDSLTVTVYNVLPTVNAGSAGLVSEGTAVVFSGSAEDPGAEALTYSWDFGDGSTTSGSLTPSHAYTNQGIYEVMLTVADDVGSVADTLTMTVENISPTVNAGVASPNPADEGGIVTFDGSAYDPGAETLIYSWNFGDGSTSSGSLTPSHAYTNQGTYEVTLMVEDDVGSVIDTLTITVNPVVPEIPTNMNITLVTSTSVAMAWSDNATYEDGYYVERSDTEFGTYEEIVDLLKNSESYTDNTVSPGSNYFYRVAAYNLPEISYSDVAEVTTNPMELGAVAAYYGSNGADWNDYIDNDGDDIFSASDSVAARVGAGGYLSVLHGGEMRALAVSGLSSCVSVTASDHLGAFQWTCLSGDPVTVVSTGLADGVYLSHLIDFETYLWKKNSVTVLNSDTIYGYTSSDIWWRENPVYEVLDSSSALTVEGAIYAVASSLTGDLLIDGDKVALVTGPDVVIRGKAQDGNVVLADSDSFLWIEAEMRGASGGTQSGNILSLSGIQYSVLRNVSASGSGTSSGISLLNSHNNWMEDVEAFSNDESGIILSSSDENRLLSSRVANNGVYGLQISNGNDNVLNTIISYNNINRGIRLDESSDNILTNLSSFNNGSDGLRVYLGGSNVLANFTGTNNNLSGLTLQGSSDNTLTSIAGVNNSYALYLYQGSDGNVFDNLASGHNNMGIWIQNSSYNRFTGLLEVGNNSSIDCTVAGTSIDPGLDGLTCENSEAELTTGVYFGDSFIAKVYVEDSQNLSDVLGSADYVDIEDWVNFENEYRGWGRDGPLEFPSSFNRSYGLSFMTLRIWDWSLDTTDTVLLEALSSFNPANTLTHTWSNDSTTQLLGNAIEILGDYIGNDNGLCEIDENCVYSPNIGSYQGHGILELLDTQPVAGYFLYEWNNNGR
jgi:parallel beta-helix repeat protein